MEMARPRLPDDLQADLEQRLGGPEPRHKKRRIRKKLTKRWEAHRAEMIAFSRSFRTTMSLIGRPFFSCSSCGARQGFYGGIARALIQVAPMPLSAGLIFHDPGFPPTVLEAGEGGGTRQPPSPRPRLANSELEAIVKNAIKYNELKKLAEKEKPGD